jgi:hypothetical protein
MRPPFNPLALDHGFGFNVCKNGILIPVVCVIIFIEFLSNLNFKNPKIIICV